MMIPAVHIAAKTPRSFGFTAFLSIHLGGAPHTWQQKILGWARNIAGKPLSPLVSKEICNIIQKGTWRG